MCLRGVGRVVIAPSAPLTPGKLAAATAGPQRYWLRIAKALPEEKSHILFIEFYSRTITQSLFLF